MFSNSRADNSDSSGPISSIIELIRALVFIYILTKFGGDWFIFVDARVLTSKLWTDRRTDVGRTVSDHNSSLSTPCSGELKRKKVLPYSTLLTSFNEPVGKDFWKHYSKKVCKQIFLFFLQ